MAGIRTDQVKEIHTLNARLCIDEEMYRANLQTAFGKTSCLQLDAEQADELIRSLRRQLPTPPAEPSTMKIRGHGSSVSAGTRKYDELLGRDKHWATPGQLRLIEVEWSRVTRATTSGARAKALNAFIEKKFRRSHITMVEQALVRKIVKTIRAMKNQSQRKPIQGDTK